MSFTLEEMRQKHSVFTYKKSNFEVRGSSLVATYVFELAPNLSFTTELSIQDIDLQRVGSLDQNLLSYWVFTIGMVEAFSYWKLSCSPRFVVEAGQLTSEQLGFWKELLQKGLSEFFFVNKIDGWQENFVEFISQEEAQSVQVDKTSHQERTLIPVGGGKDSVVSVELFKEMGTEFSTFTVNKNDQVSEVLKVGGGQHSISITRKLDPQLHELNARGYFNGHTPFSAMLAFVSTFAAYLYDYKYVALSNEFSANEGNTVFLGQHINHQYSKTLEFETNFRKYLKEYLSQTIEYFSFLRPLHELQIAKIFARYSEYLPVFLSCNRGQKTGKWCGECPKCLFVFIMLSPFVEPEKLTQVFGSNLLEKKALQPIFEELTGLTECKSLECVGTREETTFALYLAQKYYPQAQPYFIKLAQEQIFPNFPSIEKDATNFLTTFQTQHFVPQQFAQSLHRKLER